MIKSRADYLRFLEADRISLSQPNTFRARLTNQIWKFQRALRWAEYQVNCGGNPLLRLWARYRHRKLGTRLGFTIPLNTCGPGLSIAHAGTIVINGAARLGANCRIHVCVNIGTEAGTSAQAPMIGANCYIGPGAKLFGPIVIGPNTMIGANAVVNRSFPEGSYTIGGVPAKVISEKDSTKALIRGYEEQPA